MTGADVANGFSISGLLDAGSRTAGRFPVKEIPLEDITEHPGNIAYFMEDEGIARLAESIKRDGLTDLPLVRRMRGGGFQMISGHRRMAAYRLLAQESPSYSQRPCRIAADVSDEQALVLLHTANFFTRMRRRRGQSSRKPPTPSRSTIFPNCASLLRRLRAMPATSSGAASITTGASMRRKGAWNGSRK